jgi:hypothetical protein
MPSVARNDVLIAPMHRVIGWQARTTSVACKPPQREHRFVMPKLSAG